MKRKNIIPYEPVGRIMEAAGAERVSHDAKIEMAKFLTEYATGIVRKAAQYAEHAGRKTIMDEDIKLAVKNLDLHKNL